MTRLLRPLARPGLAVAVLLGATAFLAAPATSAPAQSASSGGRTLNVSQATGLDPNGQTITVEGSGYDVNKGIYVAFCVEPLPGQIPTPCGGGADTEGNTGASFWVSSNPPSYGEGLAVPYGAGGSFRQTINVSPLIGTIDCRRVQCVVATRNDHIRTSDRGQDLFVPISFSQPADPGVPDPGQPTDPGLPPEEATTTAPPTTTTTVPVPLPDEERPAPAGTVAPDGRSVSVGDVRLSATKAAELVPEGESVVVTGAGFDETKGLRVGFCAVPEGAAPGPCLDDDAAAKAVAADAVAKLDVSSNPSPQQAPTSTAYGPLGSFGTTLGVAAVIDADTDCREVRCAIVTLPHPDRPLDRGQQLVLPVTFEVEEVAATTTTSTTAAPTTTAAPAAASEKADDGDDEGSSTGLVIGLIVLALAAAGGGGAWWFRRRNATAPVASS